MGILDMGGETTVTLEEYTEIDLGFVKSELDQSLQKDSEFFDKLLETKEGIDGFQLVTEMTLDLAEQYHNFIVRNNSNPKRKSMIERSIEALMESKHKPFLLVYKGKLLGAIMLWKQDGPDGFNGEIVYQRGSLFVDGVNGLGIGKQLIRIANENAYEYEQIIDDYGAVSTVQKMLSVYGVSSEDIVISDNINCFQRTLVMEHVKKKYLDLFTYLQTVRGGDFRNLHKDEKPLCQTLIFNQAFSDKFLSTPTPDAQSV